MLSDYDITKALESGELEIDPYDVTNLGPNSYDLLLAEGVRRYIRENATNLHLTLQESNRGKTVECKLPRTLFSGDTIIVMSLERVYIHPPYVGILSARSNLSRLPLHFGFSNLIDTGFNGVITASITNLGRFPITIDSGLRFLQVMFYKTGHINVEYTERKLSKNINQFNLSFPPEFHVDKEWLHQDDHLEDRDFVSSK